MQWEQGNKGTREQSPITNNMPQRSPLSQGWTLSYLALRPVLGAVGSISIYLKLSARAPGALLGFFALCGQGRKRTERSHGLGLYALWAVLPPPELGAS